MSVEQKRHRGVPPGRLGEGSEIHDGLRPRLLPASSGALHPSRHEGFAGGLYVPATDRQVGLASQVVAHPIAIVLEVLLI